jgi:hypothetical protein
MIAHRGIRAMTKKSFVVLTFVSLLALQAAPASACKVVGHQNGEDICETTSDGGGHPYKPSEVQVTTSGPRVANSPFARRLEDIERKAHRWH